MAGAYLAIGSFFSALTRNQVIAFILGVVACGAFVFAGSPVVTHFVARNLASGLAEAMEVLSVQTRFESIQRGVLEIRDLAFFILLAVGWLWANMVILEERKAA
jgi:ABC-2 type transport system permease protein